MTRPATSSSLRRQRDQQLVCEVLTVADTFFSRLKGLLGKKGLSPGEGLLIRPARDIHTIGMKFSIDLIVLDDDLRILEFRENMSPWRFYFGNGEAKQVLELPAGQVKGLGLSVGDKLGLMPAISKEAN
jgi:uncharacterized membrane protein (UPF0127 family)